MDYGNVAENPRLVENGVKYFLNETLKQCHAFKAKYQNLMFNIGLFCLFVLILACILIYKYKGKLSPMERQRKDREKQQYILSKVQKFQLAKKQAHQELITGLPNWETENETFSKKLIY
jgi:hypothetical protein